MPKTALSQRFFKSDNYSGVHPNIMAKIAEVNSGHQGSYGADEYTKMCNQKMQEVFQRDLQTCYTFNGTGTNVLALKLALKSYQAVICADTSHINVNETGAPESVVGCKILTIATQNGKITAEQIKNKYVESTLSGFHSSMPKLVSITECSEFGTVYSLKELAEIREICDELGLLLHIDGCRIYNAAYFLGASLAEIASFADFLSLGGTKLGAMLAESLIVFNPNYFDGLEYLHKNTLQLYSKNRFIAAQYLALFEPNSNGVLFWQELAKQENELATKLGLELGKLGLKLTQKVETNHVFVETSEALAKALETADYCYIWTQNPYSVRFVVSFDNTAEDVESLVEFVRGKLAEN